MTKAGFVPTCGAGRARREARHGDRREPEGRSSPPKGLGGHDEQWKRRPGPPSPTSSARTQEDVGEPARRDRAVPHFGRRPHRPDRTEGHSTAAGGGTKRSKGAQVRLVVGRFTAPRTTGVTARRRRAVSRVAVLREERSSEQRCRSPTWRGGAGRLERAGTRRTGRAERARRDGS